MKPITIAIDGYSSSGKSTLAKAALMHKLYFNPEGKKEFIAWVAEEQSQAVDHIKYIQNGFKYIFKIKLGKYILQFI